MAGVMIVTGASRGIGAAIARCGARVGFAVCVNYARNRAAAEAVVAEIERAEGTALAVQADVAREDEVGLLFAEVDRQLGTVTALINNAGIIGGMARVEAIDGKRLLETFATNTFGSFYCAREAVRRMSTRHGGKGGTIVNISSVAARLGGLPEEVHYAASKGAVDSLTIGLAREVALEGIRVVGLRPGMVTTEIHDVHGGEAMLRRTEAAIPLGRSGTPDEIAEAAVWLTSDAASYIHGTILDVAGGR
jgi:NAD(P)-dependent dehydrogenase (short-subunit alcohol dehydrogenase family)